MLLIIITDVNKDMLIHYVCYIIIDNLMHTLYLQNVKKVVHS